MSTTTEVMLKYVPPGITEKDIVAALVTKVDHSKILSMPRLGINTKQMEDKQRPSHYKIVFRDAESAAAVEKGNQLIVAGQSLRIEFYKDKSTPTTTPTHVVKVSGLVNPKEEDIKSMFTQCGKIVSIDISSGTECSISFETQAQAEAAVAEYHNKTVKGQTITVIQEERSRSPQSSAAKSSQPSAVPRLEANKKNLVVKGPVISLLTEARLKEFLAPYGVTFVTIATVPMAPTTRHAFVSCDTEENAAKAIGELNNTTIPERFLPPPSTSTSSTSTSSTDSIDPEAEAQMRTSKISLEYVRAPGERFSTPTPTAGFGMEEPQQSLTLPNTRIYVTSTSDGWSEERLREVFSRYGNVTTVHFTPKGTKSVIGATRKGWFGDVWMQTAAQASAAISQLDGMCLLGESRLSVKQWVPKNMRPTQMPMGDMGMTMGMNPAMMQHMAMMGGMPQMMQGMHPMNPMGQMHPGMMPFSATGPMGTGHPLMPMAPMPGMPPQGPHGPGPIPGMMPQNAPFYPPAGHVAPGAPGGEQMYSMGRGAMPAPMMHPHGGAPGYGGYPAPHPQHGGPPMGHAPYPGHQQQYPNPAHYKSGGMGGPGMMQHMDRRQQRPFQHDGRSHQHRQPPQYRESAYGGARTMAEHERRYTPNPAQGAPRHAQQPPQQQQQMQPAGPGPMQHMAAHAVNALPLPDVFDPNQLHGKSAEDQREIIGEFIYNYAQQVYPTASGKIAGMLLELEQAELIQCITRPDSLRLQIFEANKLLQQA